MVCTCLDIRPVNFFCFLKTSILHVRDGGASESAAIFSIYSSLNLKNIVLSDLIVQLYNRNESRQKCFFKQP